MKPIDDWDGMFTADELQQYQGWGHSSMEQGEAFLERSNCKRLAITHHAPYRTDIQLDAMQESFKDPAVLSRGKTGRDFIEGQDGAKAKLKQHQTIFKAGDAAGTVFLIVRGSVGIFLPTNDTKEPDLSSGKRDFW